MLTSERERMQEEFDSEVGGADKFNKVKISTTDLNYINLGMSPTDLKLLDGITSSMRIISSLYGMPSVLFNDTSNSSYNNYSTAVEISYSDVYIPLANKVNEKLSIFLSDKLSVDETIIIDLKRVEGAKATTNEIAQTLNTLSPLLANNIIENMTPNEIRDIVGLTNVEGGNVITPIETPNVNVNV
jgi:phage portal protein BeeE